MKEGEPSQQTVGKQVNVRGQGDEPQPTSHMFQENKLKMDHRLKCKI